jgi:hypothetical protein
MLLACAAPAAIPALALGATRYAAPRALGAGNCASEASACTIEAALAGSASGDTVVLLGDAGTYGTSAEPLGQTLTSAKADAPAIVEGAPGQPRPVIYTSAGHGVSFKEVLKASGAETATALSGVEVRELAADHVAIETAGRIDHVIARAPAGGTACAPTGVEAGAQVVVDSLCVGEGEGSAAMASSTTGTGGHAQLELRNDTLYASGTGARGLDVYAASFTTNVSAINTIIHGQGAGIVTNGGEINLRLGYSNYENLSLSNETALEQSPAGSDETNEPALFMDAAAGDFEEAADSPTIDAGITEAANGETDLAGRGRAMGTSTDIGAYEAPATTVIPAPAPGVLGAPPPTTGQTAPLSTVTLAAGEATILTRGATVRRDAVAVKLACSTPSSGCRGVLRLTERISGEIRVRVHGRVRVRHVTVLEMLGHAPYTLVAGAGAIVLVPLDGSARAALAHARHNRLRVLLSATPRGAGRSATASLLLSAPARTTHTPARRG